MKQFKKILAGIVMALAIICLPNMVYASQNIPVTELKSITDTQTVTSTNIQVGTGEYSNKVQFTLTKPAYVYVSAYSTVMYEGYRNLGAITEFGVYSDANCSNLVLGDEVIACEANKRYSKYMCLDAGTYYIYFAKERNVDYNQESYGEFRLSVAAEYINVTGTKNATWNRATKISTDKDIVGFLSANTRTNWYKFTVADGTIAKLSIMLENPLGAGKFELEPTAVTIYKTNPKKQFSYFNIPNKYHQTVSSETLTLKKGTYYIAVTGDSYYEDGYDGINLKKSEKNNMGEATFRITTVKKTAISSLKNNKSKKAQVVYKKIADAKGYEIQYSTDKNFSKSVKTIKKGSGTTKVTLSGLTKKKTYYVRVRAWKYDTEGEQLYGEWSASKKVKITK